ncbi:MAG: TetR/AcrR family transcriptional regulator [Ignavibacteriales bacterium]
MVSRRDREKEFKKHLIAEAAYGLFSANSFDSVTVEDIAKAAEFGKGTLYQHFSSKEEILAHVMCQGIDKLCEAIETQCGRETDVMTALDNSLALQYKFFSSYSRLFLALLRRKLDGTLNPDWFEEVRRSYVNKNQLIATLMEKGIQEKRLIPTDPMRLARVLDRIIKGVSIESLTNQNFDEEKDLELIRSILYHGILINGEENK